MQKVFFCSDYHFSHLGSLKWRTQFSSVEEMNEHIIALHNSIVGKTDVVYHLGDFLWKGKPQPILERLNGYFYMVKGNHDHKTDFTLKHKVMHVVDGFYNIEIQKQLITLCHYPLVSWNRSHWGTWHLYGHHHSAIPDEFNVGKKMNVNFDVIHKPLEFEEIKTIMNVRPNNWDYINKEHTNAKIENY